MENIVSDLCGTSPEDPLPVWIHGNVGHCFNQLTLNAVPHVMLALVSACYVGTPRYRALCLSVIYSKGAQRKVHKGW